MTRTPEKAAGGSHEWSRAVPRTATSRASTRTGGVGRIVVLVAGDIRRRISTMKPSVEQGECVAELDWFERRFARWRLAPPSVGEQGEILAQLLSFDAHVQRTLAAELRDEARAGRRRISASGASGALGAPGALSAPETRAHSSRIALTLPPPSAA